MQFLFIKPSTLTSNQVQQFAEAAATTVKAQEQHQQWLGGKRNSVAGAGSADVSTTQGATAAELLQPINLHQILARQLSPSKRLPAYGKGSFTLAREPLCSSAFAASGAGDGGARGGGATTLTHRSGSAGLNLFSLQPSGCSSPENDEDDTHLWRSGTKSLQASGPPSPQRHPAGAAPEDYAFPADLVGGQGSSALHPSMAAARSPTQKEEMMELIKQLWSRPISVAQPGGDAARMARISMEGPVGGGGVGAVAGSGGGGALEEPPRSPRLAAGSVTGEMVADLTRQATGRMRAKTVFSNNPKPQSSQG